MIKMPGKKPQRTYKFNLPSSKNGRWPPRAAGRVMKTSLPLSVVFQMSWIRMFHDPVMLLCLAPKQ